MEHAAHNAGAHKGNLRAYVIGFVLALVLTAIPFWLVMYSGVSRTVILGGVAVAGLVQVLVHLHYFLHLDRSSEESWNVAAIVFTALAVVVIGGGSIWIMHTVHYNMQDPAAMTTFTGQ